MSALNNVYNDTIFAIATGAGRAGIAVVRLSGPRALQTIQAMTGNAPPARQASLRALRRPADGQIIDQAIVLTFPAPQSFTGEDVAELHVHGGPAVIAATLDALSKEPGLRPAEAGEFTRRAFENGKLDLTEVEGLADLVEAETEAQRRQALRQMEGALSRLYDGWRTQLIALMAQLEAEIDFPDEGDVTPESTHKMQFKIAFLQNALATHLNDGKRGERLRDGVRCVIVGPPNAGKSSLLNFLAGREAAIVSDIPGTTRDVVEVRLVLSGAPVWIADTAGLREAAESIEAEGVRRALARAAEADMRIGVIDGSVDEAFNPEVMPLQEHDLLIISKSDLPQGDAARSAVKWSAARSMACIHASLIYGDGLLGVEEWIKARVADLTALDESPSLSRARHRHHLEMAVQHLDRARNGLAAGAELSGEDLRLAARSLGRITGRVDVEDILDKIFSDFCIGK